MINQIDDIPYTTVRGGGRQRCLPLNYMMNFFIGKLVKEQIQVYIKEIPEL